MSTHNIGFYEDLTKNIFELSSNIIKFAPYFFCCECSLPLLVDVFPHTTYLDQAISQVISHVCTYPMTYMVLTIALNGGY